MRMSEYCCRPYPYRKSQTGALASSVHIGSDMHWPIEEHSGPYGSEGDGDCLAKDLTTLACDGMCGCIVGKYAHIRSS